MGNRSAVQTPIEGLQIADTCFYYPEDRGIAESVRLGSAMAKAVGAQAIVEDKPILERVADRA